MCCVLQSKAQFTLVVYYLVKYSHNSVCIYIYTHTFSHLADLRTDGPMPIPIITDQVDR